MARHSVWHIGSALIYGVNKLIYSFMKSYMRGRESESSHCPHPLSPSPDACHGSSWAGNEAWSQECQPASRVEPRLELALAAWQGLHCQERLADEHRYLGERWTS